MFPNSSIEGQVANEPSSFYVSPHGEDIVNCFYNGNCNTITYIIKNNCQQEKHVIINVQADKEWLYQEPAFATSQNNNNCLCYVTIVGDSDDNKATVTAEDSSLTIDHAECRHILFKALADLGGRTWRVPPQGTQFFRFDIQTLWNVAASGVHAPPPTGNPGSATVKYRWNEWFRNSTKIRGIVFLQYRFLGPNRMRSGAGNIGRRGQFSENRKTFGPMRRRRQTF